MIRLSLLFINLSQFCVHLYRSYLVILFMMSTGHFHIQASGKGQHPDRGDGAKNPTEAQIIEDLTILQDEGFKLISNV